MNLQTNRIKNYSGFTLIEMLVSMGIIILIAGFGLFLSMDFYRGYLFHYEKDLVISILQKARSQSLANIDEKPHGVYIDW